MDIVKNALNELRKDSNSCCGNTILTFEQFLAEVTQKPEILIRNVFQTFHDLVLGYVGEGVDEYPNDPESIHYVNYDCRKLFVDGADRPFFADRLFANKLINLVKALNQGSQQNKIYIFNGPPGSGKSTFLNNLLTRLEEYTSTPEGLRYETVWRLNKNLLGGRAKKQNDVEDMLKILLQKMGEKSEEAIDLIQSDTDDYIEIPCPSHDNPLMMIPKEYRKSVLDKLLGETTFSKELNNRKDYEWLYKTNSCTICSCLYQALLNKTKDVDIVHSMIFARPYIYKRRIGEGISIFNPGDPPLAQKAMTDNRQQRKIENLFDTQEIKYTFSRYAKTNNGIFAIMDVKSHNVQRLIWLHNIISEGVHKVDDIEENISSMFLAVMNPEDKKNLEEFKSFEDRIEYIRIPYVMDMNTELDIYRNTFGEKVNDAFLPGVLENFARTVISTRLSKSSGALRNVINYPSSYNMFCDENLQLLKMDLYSGKIPTWLSEEDKKKLTASVRKRVISEAEFEGERGISGRDSIKIFNEFYTQYYKENKLIDMYMLFDFFRTKKDLSADIPAGFLESLIKMYDYNILQDVKEALFHFNDKRISKDIQNYLFAVNFDIGEEEVCQFTGEKISITKAYLEKMERYLLNLSVHDSSERCQDLRESIQNEYASTTLTQEMRLEGKKITQTKLYNDLRERYIYRIKETVLDPFEKDDNFRRAIKDYGTKDFRTYTKKIQNDVHFVIKNMIKRGYTERGARDICIYVIDKNLVTVYRNSK